MPPSENCSNIGALSPVRPYVALAAIGMTASPDVASVADTTARVKRSSNEVPPATFALIDSIKFDRSPRWANVRPPSPNAKSRGPRETTAPIGEGTSSRA
jgi:hypothetical protein